MRAGIGAAEHQAQQPVGQKLRLAGPGRGRDEGGYRGSEAEALIRVGAGGQSRSSLVSGGSPFGDAGQLGVVGNRGAGLGCGCDR